LTRPRHLPEHALKVSDTGLILIYLPIAQEGALSIMVMKFAPFDNRVGVKLMCAGGLRHTLARFDFAHDLEFERFGELATLQGLGCSLLVRIPP
jgi:hypothetical protein